MPVVIHILHKPVPGNPPRVNSVAFINLLCALPTQRQIKLAANLSRHLAHRGWRV